MKSVLEVDARDGRGYDQVGVHGYVCGCVMK